MKRYNVSLYKMIGLSMFIAASLTIFCDKPTEGTIEESTGNPIAEFIVPVSVQQVNKSRVEQAISLTGSIKPFQEAVVASEASGKIIKSTMEVGRSYKKGEILVQLDDELNQLSVDQARARLLQAQVSYNQAKRDLERNEKLYKTNDVSEYMLETARLNEQISLSELQLAEASLKVTERQLADTRIVSPFSGKIAQKMVNTGEKVSPGTQIAKIVDIRSVRVAINVPEEEITQIQIGAEVKVTVDAIPGKIYTGRIYTISPSADLNSRTFPVEILVPNEKKPEIRAGMVARVRIIKNALEDVILIPQDVIIERGDSRYVYVAVDGKAEERKLRLGETAGENVIIEEGLQEGDVLIVLGQINLKDGTKITVQP